MTEITTDSHPTEYERPRIYQRPIGGIVRAMDRVFHGMTQAEAIKPETSNG